ncbi:MAG: hypothetical protein ACTSO2_14040 [Promethearchaeota archaeon]
MSDENRENMETKKDQEGKENASNLEKGNEKSTINGNEKGNVKENKKEIGEKKVIIHAAAYKSIILYSTRYANPAIPREQWKEIYGILIGVKSDDAVIVEQAIPMTYGESTDVTLGPEHYGFIEEIQDKLDKEGKGRFMVGWFHSHPGLSLFYSYVDINNQIFFQSLNPDFIGIVFDHTYVFDKNLRPKSYEMHPSPFNPDYKITEDSPTHPFKTGIVCYRLNDPSMDVNDPNFDINYHDVPYEIIGLDQTFFASLLTELSGYYTAGKPLEKAYKEEEIIRSAVENQQINGLSAIGWEKRTEPMPKVELKEIGSVKDVKSIQKGVISNPQNQRIINSSTYAEGIEDMKDLSEISSIPIQYNYGAETMGDGKSLSPELQKLKMAEELKTQGKTDFLLNDSFSAIEKYKQAIEILEELGDKYKDRILQVYADVTESCIKSEHFNLAIEFGTKLKEKAEKLNDSYQLGNGHHYLGLSYLHKNELDKALEHLKKASVEYEKVEDYAGNGKINELIGQIYEKNNDIDSAVLFYSEAIQNYFQGIKKYHVKRREKWALTTNLKSSIKNLKVKIKNLFNSIEDEQIRNKVKKDLDQIPL